MGFPLYVICCFSIAAFNILSLCLVFLSLISMCLTCFSLGLSCTVLSVPLELYWLFPFPCWENFQLYSLQKFSHALSFSSSSGTPIIWMLVHLILFQRSLKWSPVLFIFFFLLYSALQKIFPLFYLPAHWVVLLLQLFSYWFLLEYFSFQ